MESDGSSTVVLTVASDAWREELGDLEPLAARIVGATLDRAAITPWLKAGEVSLLLADDSELRSLNASYRSRDRSTNVLSFPGLDLDQGEAEGPKPPGAVLLGDVAISIQRLKAEAASEEKSLADHFAHLLAHGTLHLLGYDHLDGAQARVMEGLEETILEALGFAAPYAPLPKADAMSAAT